MFKRPSEVKVFLSISGVRLSIMATYSFASSILRGSEGSPFIQGEKAGNVILKRYSLCGSYKLVSFQQPLGVGDRVLYIRDVGEVAVS